VKMYLVSLGAGALVGVIYSLLQVRSPAPPLIALIGLLGMLFGEHVIPVSMMLIDKPPEFLQIWIRPAQAAPTAQHPDRAFGNDDRSAPPTI
jgi:XapX domain-containing protein